MYLVEDMYIFIRNLCMLHLYMHPYMSLATRRKYDYVQTFILLATPMEVHFGSQHAFFPESVTMGLLHNY